MYCDYYNIMNFYNQPLIMRLILNITDYSKNLNN